MSTLNLEKVLESIDLNPDGQGDRISGKRITLNRKQIDVFLGVGGDKRLHLLIGPASNEIESELRTIQLKNLGCGILDWSVDHGSSTTFIDIACLVDFESGIKMPFLSFAEDVIRNLEAETRPPVDVIKKVFRRWRRFWTGDVSALPPAEWVRGLFGELCFLERLIDRKGNSALGTWRGPSDGTHDFSGGKIAFEVKTSQSRPVTVQIHGLNQLDQTKWEVLFLVVFRLEESVDGRSLADLVRRLEDRLASDSPAQELFWSMLSQAGYRRDLEHLYARSRFLVNEPEVFTVDEEFPKLNKSSFDGPLDMRVFDIRYRIELTGINAETIADAFPSIDKMVNECQ